MLKKKSLLWRGFVTDRNFFLSGFHCDWCVHKVGGDIS